MQRDFESCVQVFNKIPADRMATDFEEHMHGLIKCVQYGPCPTAYPDGSDYYRWAAWNKLTHNLKASPLAKTMDFRSIGCTEFMRSLKVYLGWIKVAPWEGAKVISSLVVEPLARD